MARPKNKAELLTAATHQYTKLQQLVDSLPADFAEADFTFSSEFLAKKKEAHWTRDQNLRDVLIHLYEWQQLLLTWVADNQQGQARPFLPAPYNWRSYGAMNEEFVVKHQNTSLAEAKALLADSHQQTLQLLSNFSDEALFTKKYYPWTGSSTLGSYGISATSSHYDWAIKKLKQAAKTQKNS